MRNATEDSNNTSWHLFNTLTNNHYYDNFTPRTVTDAYSGHDKHELKQKMLQHEAIFKNQVYELHRLYRRQRDLIEEIKIKRKGLYKYHVSIDTSSSSSLVAYRKPCAIFGAEISNSPLSCSKGNASLKDCEVVECRPSKVRKKLFDLELPAHEYTEPEEAEHTADNNQISAKENGLVTNGVKTFFDDGGKKDSCSMRSNGLADLNEPVYSQDVDFLGPAAKPGNDRNNMNHTSRFTQIPLLFSPPSAYPFTSTSDMGNSWGKSNDSLTHKLTLCQTYPSFIASHNSHEVFRDKWHMNVNGSSPGLKEPFARVHSVNFGPQKIFKGSNFVDLTDTIKDMDMSSVQNLSKGDDNSRNFDQTVLPWLKTKPVICKNGDMASASTIERLEIDINVAWDVYDDIDKQINVKKDAAIKNNFDLNSCVTDDDDLLVTESFKSSKRKTIEIDLEAPAVSEIDEEDEPDNLENKELQKFAAEAIVAMSSQQDHVGPVSKAANDNGDDDDPLLWFADVINSGEKNIASETREIDEYEMLTLQLEETKEEDYMPTPSAPENQEPDEVGPEDCRPRRGQGRRGRARRDFQRDTLPGITSLSRHEITEDIQIFGGLMRATGHSWNLGSKRNGARGRRKLKAVETAPPPPPLKLSPSSKQVLGLDERRLTGWGKTTRRPRRQRCAAANSVVVRIT
ncbi:uncharacterized protein LOC143541413 [Bidens hawaiensis]|uniref:uncharacterized protein LOC143541413 n=1 Tax=Bidens hawaiensis TaxID=980011 RepID=UPI00404A2162